MPSHVFGNGGFTHRDSQLLKLSVNPRGAPKWVCSRHLTNQHADVRAARSIHDGQLVSEREDFQVQRQP